MALQLSWDPSRPFLLPCRVKSGPILRGPGGQPPANSPAPGLLDLALIPGPAVDAFQRVKQTHADTTALSQPLTDAPLSIVADASNCVVSAALHKQTLKGIQPLPFYSAKLAPPQTRYSTSDGGLLAIYLAIKNSRNYVEDRYFCVYTDRKPLTYAFSTPSDMSSPS
nr:unnamed protein product [Spirometra erinaceieuropaei]